MNLDSYITLGRSGLRVSPYTLGTMTFGEDHGWGASPEVSSAILSEYLDRGGNFLDTANIYTNGHSEQLVGEFLAARPGLRDRLVIGTKFFGNLHAGDPNGGGAGRKAVINQFHESLRRLGTDYIDIYWLHNWDRGVPIEETLRALDDLVTSGKVRYIGVSDLPAWVVSEGQTLAALRGWNPIIAMQVEYSLLERTVEGELLPMAERHGIGVMPWSPLGSGKLTGKYRRDADATAVSGRAKLVGGPSERDWTVIDTLERVAGEAGVSMPAAALAWVRSRPGVASTLIGARTLEQLRENLDSIGVGLTPEQLQTLTEASMPRLNFPAANNAGLGPILAFGGMSVDGREYPESPLLGASPQRY
jgi:aryl-alcohol dehydrogenase-like predicted oxidoreductase